MSQVIEFLLLFWGQVPPVEYVMRVMIGSDRHCIHGVLFALWFNRASRPLGGNGLTAGLITLGSNVWLASLPAFPTLPFRLRVQAVRQAECVQITGDIEASAFDISWNVRI